MVAVLEKRIDALGDELVAFLRRRCPSQYEELAQETWLKVSRANPTCPDARSFRAYVFATARRLLIDHHRRNARQVRVVSLEGGLQLRGAADPESSARAGQVLAIVEAELSEMKPEVAQVFRWRTSEDLSFKDIAARQGCSINTALGRMHQATKRLGRALTRTGLIGETP